MYELIQAALTAATQFIAVAEQQHPGNISRMLGDRSNDQSQQSPKTPR